MGHASAERLDRESSGAFRSIATYLIARFPLHTQGAALVVTYACAYAAFARPSLTPLVSWRALCGAATFVLLFLQLRLVDDIDDASSDGAASGMGTRDIRARRRGLIGALLGTVLAVAWLNAGSSALWVALLATAGATGTTFALRRWIGRTVSRGTWWKDAALGVFYEGTHFAMILYVYFVGHPGLQDSLPWTTVLPVTGTFFTAFELWKYSRYVTRPTWRPYGLEWGAARIALVMILVISMVCQVAMALVLHLAGGYLAYAGLMPAVFATWLIAIQPVEHPGASRARGSMGMLYVVAVNTGVAAALWPPRVFETMNPGG